MDIGAFYGKDSKNNEIILRVLAINGSLIKWEVLKKAKEITKRITWATISRRIDNLKERDYLAESGKRRITVAKREEDTPVYGLTWRGLIASLTIKEVRNNIAKVIENNPKLEPLQKLYLFVKGIYTEEDIRNIIERFLKALDDVPLELEYVNPMQFIFYVLPNIVIDIGNFLPKGIVKIEESPELLEFFYKIVIQQEKFAEESLENCRRMREWLEQKLKK
jgi:hypothetical protein